MKKNNIFNILGFATFIVLVFMSGCKEDEYDFNKMIPGISNLTGPAEVVGTGKTLYRYSVADRTGSTYTWTLEGSTGKMEFPVKGLTSIVDVIFDESSVDIPEVKLIVSETTKGGLKSDPDTILVFQKKYCSLDMEQFVGDYIVTDGTDSGNCSIARDADDELFGLIITDVLSYWGFAAGEGGVLKIKMNGCDNSVSFDKQATGAMHPSYGDISMEALDANDDPIKGSFDPATNTIHITAKHTVSAGSFGSWEIVLTKQ